MEPFMANVNALITGGCGFIGSNFIRCLLKARNEVHIVNVDQLTYAGNLANLADVDRDFSDRYRFFRGDIGDREQVKHIFRRFPVDWVVNFAAESHVDRSIMHPEIFIKTNIYGTFNLLEHARERLDRLRPASPAVIPLSNERRGPDCLSLRGTAPQRLHSLGCVGRAALLVVHPDPGRLHRVHMHRRDPAQAVGPARAAGLPPHCAYHRSHSVI